MKEKIKQKLEKYAEGIIEKENPTMEDINFIVFLLNRIECKENAEQLKLERENSNKQYKEAMANLIGGAFNG